MTLSELRLFSKLLQPPAHWWPSRRLWRFGSYAGARRAIGCAAAYFGIIETDCTISLPVAFGLPRADNSVFF